ncbi:MAG: glycosyltransferase 87 family protein [Candidatus Dormibacteraeota bacterium]|nr:glycosyltransferase 87 family protein [Candidatus Dormibacteraeota bacterium]
MPPPNAPSGDRLAWTPGLVTAACLVICLIYGAWQLSPVFWSQAGNDSRVFYAAARLASSGDNPYDFGRLAAVEAQVNAEARAAGSGRDSLSPNEYHYPPVMTRAFIALAPLGDFGFLVAVSLLALVAGVIGFELILSALHWRGRWLPRLFFVVSLPMLTVLSSGNPATLLLLPWGGAFVASRRGRPLVAGMLLAACWIKPPVGVPVAVALLVLERARWRPMLAGLAIGTAVFAGANVAAGGVDGTLAWLRSLVDFSATINANQTAVIQQRFLAGLSAPLFFLGPLAAGAIAVAVVTVVLLWARRGGPLGGGGDRAPLGLALLTAAALAVAPYIHTYDLVLMAAPVLVLSGLPLTTLNRGVLLLWALAPVLNLGVVLAVVAVTGSLDTSWSFAAGLNALTLLAVAIAAGHARRATTPATQPATA